MDMIVFSLFFLVFLSEKLRLPDVFLAGQRELNVYFGLANTLILLTSSWAMVEAVNNSRNGNGKRARGWLDICLLFGLLFSLNKVIEYTLKIGDSVTPASNSFFAFYFAITGIHFAHVVAGMAFILYCRNHSVRNAGRPGYVSRLESTGLFWHFVDVLWIFIFPLLYLSSIHI